MAIYCIQCGKELPDDANFCLKCGKPVGNAARPTPRPEPICVNKIVSRFAPDCDVLPIVGAQSSSILLKEEHHEG
jgi:predicted amidophosphoribosyltransferase